MMNQEDIFKKIGQILNELQDQYDFLAQNPKQLNELELELFLANANFLSDHVQIIRKINNNKTVKTLPQYTEDHTEVIKAAPEQEQWLPKAEEFKEPVKPAFQDDLFKPDIEPSKFEFILNEDPLTDRFEFEEKSIDNIFDRPLSKEESLIIEQKQKLQESQQNYPVEPDKDDEVGPEPFLVAPASAPAPLISENAASNKPEVTEPRVNPEVNNIRPTLNDLLAGKNNRSGYLNEENNKTVITDLKQAISLNEKLLYIKDLFNGYNLAYAEAIDLINKMPDFKTVDAFLKNNYAIKNNWASKQNTVDQFYELLNQRFPAK